MQWLIDSDCSKHMIEDENKFVSLNEDQRGNVIFGNKEPTMIKWIGKIILEKGNTKA